MEDGLVSKEIRVLKVRYRVSREVEGHRGWSAVLHRGGDN